MGRLGMIMVVALTLSLAIRAPSIHAQGPEGSPPGALWVIDTERNAVVATVPVGVAPSHVALSPDGSLAYVTNGHSDDLSIVDTATNSAIDTIPVGALPFSVAVSADGRRAYIAAHGANQVSVVDTVNRVTIAEIPTAAGPASVLANPNLPRLAVTHTPADTVLTVIDTTSNSVAGTINRSWWSHGLGAAQTPDATRLYLANALGVMVLDTGSGAVEHVDLDHGTFSVAVSPDGQRLYALATFRPYLTVIDTASNVVTTTMQISDNALGLSGTGAVAISPDGSRAYVIDLSGGRLIVVDLAGSRVVATVPVGPRPTSVALSRDGRRAYVTVTGFD